MNTLTLNQLAALQLESNKIIKDYCTTTGESFAEVKSYILKDVNPYNMKPASEVVVLLNKEVKSMLLPNNKI